MNISDTIKAEVARLKLTAYAVAKLAGITPNVVSRFLRAERRRPTPAPALRLVRLGSIFEA